MEKVIEKVLERLPQGTDAWIFLGGFLLVSFFWTYFDKKRAEKAKLRQKILVSLIILALASSCVLARHVFFPANRPFRADVCGILVLRISGDADGTLRHDLGSSLNTVLGKYTGHPKLALQMPDRSVSEDAGLQEGHEEARKIGRKLNAEIVIWGTKVGEKKFHPRITLVKKFEHLESSANRALSVQNISEATLPAALVQQPICLAYFVIGNSKFIHKEYQSALNFLEPALKMNGLSETETAEINLVCGLCHLSVAKGQTDMGAHLEQATTNFQTASQLYKKETQPIKWAAARNDLGLVYSELRRGDLVTDFQNAIRAFEEASEVLSPKESPLQWAYVQSNLALCRAGAVSGSTVGDLTKAAISFEDAVRILTKLSTPLQTAGLQINLALAHRLIGTQDHLLKSIAILESALGVLKEHESPHEWALAQLNLGAAYSELQVGNPAMNLNKALNAYESALRVRTLKDHPVEFAEVQLRLGGLYQSAHNASPDAASAKALAAYDTASTLLAERDFPAEWATLQTKLAVLYSRGSKQHQEENLEKAVALCGGALRVWRKDTFPVEWARVQSRLASFYVMRSKNREANLRKALAAEQEALGILTRENFPWDWANLMHLQGITYLELDPWDAAGTTPKAIESLEPALTVFTEKDFPEDWARVQSSLGIAYRDLGDDNDQRNFKKAKEALQAALRVRTQDTRGGFDRR